MNIQVNTEEIPTIDELNFEKLPIVFKKKSVISRLIFSTILGTTATIFWLLNDVHIAVDIAYVLVISLLVLNVIYPLKSYYYKSYAVRENDILYNSGIFFRRTVIVPFNRIQHVEIKQGPVDRSFDLANLVFFTAGGSSSDLEIDGLIKADAEKIKHYTIDKIGVLIEE